MHTNFAMMQNYFYSLSELDSMIPWEREVYVQLLVKHLDEEKKRHEADRRNM